jgi:hypothetical protein
MRAMKTLSTLILAVATLGACGDDGGGTSGGPDAAVGDVTPLIGTISVNLVPELMSAGTTQPAYSALLGKVFDGAQPEAVIWEMKAAANGCTLYTPRVPFCATPCGSAAVCVETDTCKPYPASQLLGDITVTGLVTKTGEDSFTMKPVANAYQPPSTVQLDYPAFVEGEKFEMKTTGSSFAPSFTIGTRGVAPLVLTTSPIDLKPNTALALAWTAPTAAGSEIHIKLDISHHGGSKGKLECDLADSGSTTIDAGLITQLLNLGAAGYPTIVISRSHTGSAAVTAGRIDLAAVSTVEKPVTVPGIISCTDTSECPMGQTCQSDLTCK